MRFRWSVGLLVSTLSFPAAAQEAEGEGEASASVDTSASMDTSEAVAPAPAAPAESDSFAAPNGQLGAGLSITQEKVIRAYGELGVYSYGFDIFDTSITFWSVSMILGGGYKISPELEIEAMLPLAMAAVSVDSDNPDAEGENGYAVGNLHLGVNYVRAQGPLRMKIGGALQHGIWTIDPDDNFFAALLLARDARAMHDLGLWAHETLSLVTPSRVEWGERLVVSGDGQLGLHIPTNGNDVEVTIQIDPGIGYYATPDVLVGARLPFIWIPTASGEGSAQVAFEPYGRFDFGNAFANARFTLNIDEPLGFAFDEGRIWAIHVGGGGVF